MWVLVALAAAAFWPSSSSAELYERLSLKSDANAKDIKKAWHLAALKLHPDKVEGERQKEEAAERFKRAAEAYEVLSDAQLRAAYDRTGTIPSDKDKSAAASRGGPAEEEDYGFEAQQQQQQQRQQHGWRGRHWGGFNAFEVGLAQGRARRVRSLETLRSLLREGGPGGRPRLGLVGFYRRGEEGTLKHALRFPYPFAGWSLAAEGDGFWWEDELQTALVSVGELGADGGKSSPLLAAFGLTADSQLPAVAWVRREPTEGGGLDFELGRPRDFEGFVSWVYERLGATIRVTNHDHRVAQLWWLDGRQAKKQASPPLLAHPPTRFWYGSGP